MFAFLRERSRLISLVILSLIFLIGVFLRVSNWDEVFGADGHLRFFDPDSYYQLRRLAFFLQNFPQVQSFDPFLDWPSGSRVDWPPAMVWLFGLPLYLIGVSSQIELEWGVSGLNIVLGVLAILLTYWGSKKICEDYRLQMSAAFLAAMSPLLIRYTCLGQLDHHVIEMLLPAAALICCFSFFEKPRLRLGIVLGLLSGLALLSSSVLIALSLWIPVFMALGLKDLPTVRPMIGFLLSYLFFTGFAVLSIGGTPLFSVRAQFLLMIVSLALAALILVFRFKSRKIFGGFAVLILVAGLFFSQSLWGLFRSAQAYLLSSESFLSGVLEAQPLFGKWTAADFGYVHQYFGYFVYLVFGFASLVLIRPKIFNRSTVFLCLYALPFLILLLLQKRFQVFVGVLYVWLLIAMLAEFWKLLSLRDLRVHGAVAVLLVAMTLSPALRSDFALRPLAMHKVDFPVTDLILEKLKITPELAWQRLGQKEAASEGFLVNPNLGHLILYRIGLPTTDNSFYRESSLRADLARRNLRSDKELLQDLRAQKIKYFLVSDDLKYHRFLWQQFDPEAKQASFPLQFVTQENGRQITNFDLGAMEEFAWYRLLTTEKTPKGVQFIFGIRVPRSGHFYETVKMFEIESEL